MNQVYVLPTKILRETPGKSYFYGVIFYYFKKSNKILFFKIIFLKAKNTVAHAWVINCMCKYIQEIK